MIAKPITVLALFLTFIHKNIAELQGSNQHKPADGRKNLLRYSNNSYDQNNRAQVPMHLINYLPGRMKFSEKLSYESDIQQIQQM